MIRDYIVFVIGVALGIAALLLGVQYQTPQIFGDAASVWYPKGGTTKYLTPVNNTWGLLVPGLATTTTGCLSVNSIGWITPSGSACGAGGGSFSTSTNNYWAAQGLGFSTTSTNYWKSVTDLFSTTSAAYFITATTSLPQLAAVKSTLTGTLAANAGTLYTQATTTASCSGNTTCTSFTVLGSSPVTISSTGGGTGLSTTTPIANSNVLVYSTAGAGAAYGAATGTITNGTGISVTAGQSVIGSGLTITNTSPLSGLTASFPFSFSNPTLTWLGFSTTTNSGMAAGNLYVGSGGIFQTSASSSIFGYTPLNPTRALTVAGTANQITSSAGAQDLSADRTWTLSLPSHVIFPGNFQVTNTTTTNATTTGSQYFTSSVVANSSLLRTDSTGKLSAVTIGTNISFDGTTISATGGTGSGLTTTTPIANSNVLVYSSSGAGAAYGAATGTLTGAGGVTVSGTGSVIGSLTINSFSYPFPSNATSTETTFTRLVATNSTTTNATTTNFAIVNILNCNSGNKLATNAAGAVICDTDQTGAGGGTFPFTPLTTYSTNTSATTTALWSQAALYASSTLIVGTSTWVGLSINGTTGKGGFGANNTSPALFQFGVGTNANVNPNIKLMVTDPADARAGVAVNDRGTFISSGDASTYSGVFSYDYLNALPLNLALNQFGGNVGVGTTSPYAKLSVVGPVVASSFTATSSASNTLPNLTSTNSTTTNATTTNLSAVILNATNGSLTTLSVIGSSGVTAAKYNATNTTATSTFSGAFTIGTTSSTLGATGWMQVVSNMARAIGGLAIATMTNVVNAFSVINAAGTTVFNIDTTQTQTRVAVGTTTSSALFDIAATFGNMPFNNWLFRIGSSTPTATTTVFGVNEVGHIIASGTAPTILSGALTVSGNDTVGSTTPTAGVTRIVYVRFAYAWRDVPVCMVNLQPATTTLQTATTTVLNFVATTTTQFAVAASAPTIGSSTITWNCLGYRDGTHF